MKLVLLPGMDGTGKQFASFVRCLPDVVAAKVVSYSSSVQTYEDVLALLRSLQLEGQPFIIVAESFSTPAAIAWAAENPPNLKGLVVCAGFTRSPIRGPLRTLCEWLAGSLPQSSSGLAIRMLLVGPGAPASLVDEVSQVLASVNPKMMAARLRAILACDVRLDLERLQVPILFLQPSRDRLVGRRAMREMKRIKPSAACEVVDGPHLLLQRKPEECAALIAKFVERIS